jgi:nucleoside-diphosphate-sugar epimerase
VHVDDLGEAYVKLAKLGAPAVGHQIYNIAALGDNPTFLELKYYGAKAAGWNGAKEDIKSIPVPEDQPRVKNWEWNVVINPRKVMDATGWTPSHVGVIHEMELYEKAWRLEYMK